MEDSDKDNPKVPFSYTAFEPSEVQSNQDVPLCPEENGWVLTPEIQLSVFKTLGNSYRTKGLFYETRTPTDNSQPVFTLKPFDYKGYKSFRRLYLSYRDPSEYKMAMGILGSWEHWQKIAKASSLIPYVKEWREELEVLLKADSLAVIRQLATRNDSTGFNAAKFLTEKGWDRHVGSPGRRPKTKPGEDDKHEDATKKALKMIQDDYDRILV